MIVDDENFGWSALWFGNDFICRTFIVGLLENLVLNFIWVLVSWHYVAISWPPSVLELPKWRLIYYLYLKRESESRSLLRLWIKSYLSFKLIHDSFGDYQAKSDSSLIHQLIIIHKRKESKELVLVILLNAYSRIDHGDLQKGLSLLFNDSNFYFNFTLLGEFKSVALESEEYLHETSSICDDEVLAACGH